ncbi:MAG: hypothetical protein IT372_00820, partial [Polyangiaceae bacterium]|nr:hypothetical protein [Polyangiaceae bacterium]
MARPSQITSTPIHVPCVLVVMDAVWPELFARCLVAATRSGVLVHRCELQAAATFAAEKRPVAIVLSNAVYSLDPVEIDALARDVHATLLKVDEEVTERELEAMFSGALRERERREDGGRYAIIRQTQSETPMPRSTQAPPSMRLGGPSSSRTMPPASVRPGGPASARTMPPASHRAGAAPAPAFAPPPASPRAGATAAP